MNDDLQDSSWPQELAEHRKVLFGIAYRILGSVADAEDLVQDSILRLHRARAAGTVIESEKAFLATIVTRMAIDHLGSARVRREEYVGFWLREPVLDDREPEAARHVEIAESLSMAFLLVLETLSPVERAVFLLREVFEYEYDEIAKIVGKAEENCRQLFGRAKRHIDAGKPRFETSPERRDELARRFFAACETGNIEDLVKLLAADVTVYGDGGGKATAILQPVTGREHVARLLHGFFVKGWQIRMQVRPATVNGQPGALVFDSQDRLISVIALDIADGVVQAVRSVVNPDKLRHLGPLSDAALLPESAPQRQGVTKRPAARS
jgi:RNA polymerase sigma-70 factor (ECF subfamily)